MQSANKKSLSPGVVAVVPVKIESFDGTLARVITTLGCQAYPNGTKFGLDCSQIEVPEASALPDPAAAKNAEQVQRLSQYMDKNFKSDLGTGVDIADSVIALIQRLAKAAK